MKKVIVYGFMPEIYNCAPCNNAKSLLERKQIDFEFKSVANRTSSSGLPVMDNATVSELTKLLNRTSGLGITMPQIFIKDGDKMTSIGGFDKLVTTLRENPEIFK